MFGVILEAFLLTTKTICWFFDFWIVKWAITCLVHFQNGRTEESWRTHTLLRKKYVTKPLPRGVLTWLSCKECLRPTLLRWMKRSSCESWRKPTSSECLGIRATSQHLQAATWALRRGNFPSWRKYRYPVPPGAVVMSPGPRMAKHHLWMWPCKNQWSEELASQRLAKDSNNVVFNIDIV